MDRAERRARARKSTSLLGEIRRIIGEFNLGDTPRGWLEAVEMSGCTYEYLAVDEAKPVYGVYGEGGTDLLAILVCDDQSVIPAIPA